MFKRQYFTVQCPIANNSWQQCGDSRYMDKDIAEQVYRDCAEHIAVAMFGIDQMTGEFEQYEIKRNF